MRRAESCKVEYYDQMPDWSCSYRQGNSGQLSEIAEANNDDVFQMTTFADAVTKSNPFEINYYSSSTRSRLARRQMSKEMSGRDMKAEASMHKYVDQYNINKNEPRKLSQLEKIQSYAKPVLPLLNIARVKDDNQNILAIKGLHEATRNKSSRSPHLSVGLSRVGQVGEFNMSIGDPDGSFIKGDTSRRENISSTQKLKVLARRLGESYFTKDLPGLTKILRSDKEYENLSQTRQANMAFKNTMSNTALIMSQRERSKTCS